MVVLPQSPAREFLAVSSEDWTAVATFAGPVFAGLLVAFLGVYLAGRRLRHELKGQDARRYFLEEGLLKLSGSLDQMLGAIRINYAICGQLIRLLRNVERNHPIAPRPDDLPQLVPAITDATAFAAIGPSSRITDFDKLGDLATKAFARLLNINLWFFTEIWLATRAHYSKDDSSVIMDTKAADKLIAEATAKYSEAEEFQRLPSLLADMAVRATEIGLNSFDDFWRVRKDKEIVRLRGELSALLDQLTEAPPAPSAN